MELTTKLPKKYPLSKTMLAIGLTVSLGVATIVGYTVGETASELGCNPSQREAIIEKGLSNKPLWVKALGNTTYVGRDLYDLIN